MTNVVVVRAHAFALRAHEHQKRKYTDEPYIVHPVAVAKLIEKIGGDAEMQAAAMLHDVIEDCGVTYDEIEREFGRRVADLVQEVTNPSKRTDGNRARRKAIDREHLAQASPDGKTIKLADIIDNIPSIVENDPDFAQVFMREKRDLLPVLVGGNREFFSQVEKMLLDYFSKK